MFDDFKDLLSAFNPHRVKYLVVGGYAVSFHSQPRATKDLDLFIQADLANAQAAYAALASFGAPLDGIRLEDLADRSKFFRFGQPPLAVDIMPNIDGVIFDEAWERRVDAAIDEGSDVIASFLSKRDLIASKIAAGRMRDLADVEEIREAESSRDKPDTNQEAQSP